MDDEDLETVSSYVGTPIRIPVADVMRAIDEATNNEVKGAYGHAFPDGSGYGFGQFNGQPPEAEQSAIASKAKAVRGISNPELDAFAAALRSEGLSWAVVAARVNDKFSGEQCGPDSIRKRVGRFEKRQNRKPR
jgi:hypothetical protein